MGPKPLRATSRKVANELPETLRANFLTAAAQLFSTSLPQLSTHLGQQALLYADAQQALVPSLTAKLQLCRKCGSPLNRHTCANVHIAWLSMSSSERLSKKLPAHSSGQGRGAKAGSSKQKNTVVAVRVCVACQEPSVRPFLSLGLAQKHLAAEGFADVPVVGLDPKQQIIAQQQQKQHIVQQQQSSPQRTAGGPQHLRSQQQTLQEQQEQTWQQHPIGQKRDAEESVLSSAKRQAVGTSAPQQQQQLAEAQPGRYHQHQQQQQQQPKLQVLQENSNSQQQLEQQVHSQAGNFDQPLLLQQQALRQPEQQKQKHIDSCSEQWQQQHLTEVRPQGDHCQHTQQQSEVTVAAGLQPSMDQQRTVAIHPGAAGAGAGSGVHAGLERKAAVPHVMSDTAPAVPDQQQQPEADSNAPAAPVAEAGADTAAESVQYIPEPIAAVAAGELAHQAQEQQQQQQQEGSLSHVGAAPAFPAMIDLQPTVAAAAASMEKDSGSAAAATVVVSDAAVDPVVTAAVVTAEQPRIPAVVAVATQPLTSALLHSNPVLDASDTVLAVAATAADDSPALGAATAEQAVASPAPAVSAAFAVSAPLAAGIDQLPGLYAWHTPQPAAAVVAAGDAAADEAAAVAPQQYPDIQPLNIFGSVESAAIRTSAFPGDAASPAAAVPAANAAAAADGLPADAAAVTTDAMDIDTGPPSASDPTAAAAGARAEDSAASAAAAPAAAASGNAMVHEQQAVWPSSTASAEIVDQNQAAPGIQHALQANPATAMGAATAGVAEASGGPDVTTLPATPEVAGTQDATPAIEPAPAALTAAAATATPVAAAAGSGMRGVFGSKASQAAVARLAAQAWPIAPMLAPAAGTAAAAAEPDILVISDDVAISNAVGTAAADAGYGSGSPETVGQDAPGTAGSGSGAEAKVELAGMAAGPAAAAEADSVDVEVADLQAAAADPGFAAITAAGGLPPAASTPAPAGTFAAALQRATSSGIEADVSSGIESEAADGDDYAPLLPATVASPDSKCTSAGTAAVAAEAEEQWYSTDSTSSSDDDSGSDSGDGDGRPVSQNDDNGDAGVPYAGPWVGGVRPAHASTYDSDSQGLSQSQSQSIASSAQAGGGESASEESESASEDEQPQQVEGRLAQDTVSPAVAHPDPTAPQTTSAAGEQQQVDTDEFFADEEESSEAVSDDSESASADSGDEDEDMSEEYSSDSSTEGEEGIAEHGGQQQQSSPHETEAMDDSMIEQPAEDARVTGVRGLGPPKLEAAEVQARQQQGARAADVQQMRQGEDRIRQWRQQHKADWSHMMLRHVCARSHLLRKQAGRKALRHWVYR